MITLVQHMYKPRDIANFKTATAALDLLTSTNDVNKSQPRFTTNNKTHSHENI